MSVRFEETSRCPHTSARTGRLHTPHGIVETPCFMPVGTQGTVKGLSSEDLETIGFRMVLANTYHLALRPGAEAVAALGGLHRFMGWQGAILTDSGGYQAFSLASGTKLTPEGVHFRSHLDGSPFLLTPEECVRTQAALGVDVSMALDDCPPFPCTPQRVAEAVERTTEWAGRCLAARSPGQALFGIVQGGVHPELRQQSLGALAQMEFEGLAIGGVSVGEPTELQRRAVSSVAPHMPGDRPRYLMGVGHPADILHAVGAGVDMFDCVLPTRLARHNTVYTLQGRRNASAAAWADHAGPWDDQSVFPGLERYSAAYVRHLLKAKEQLGARLATVHNLSFYARLMKEAREAILGGTWPALLARYAKA
jgi:queuine tRNA-ribosyltransferase